MISGSTEDSCERRVVYHVADIGCGPSGQLGIGMGAAAQLGHVAHEQVCQHLMGSDLHMCQACLGQEEIVSCNRTEYLCCHPSAYIMLHAMQWLSHHIQCCMSERGGSRPCVWRASDLHALIAGMASQLSNCCTSGGSGVLLGHCLPCGKQQDR